MRSLRFVATLILLVSLLAMGCDRGAGEDATVPSTLPAGSTTAASTTTTTVPSIEALGAQWMAPSTSLVAVSAGEVWVFGWVGGAVEDDGSDDSYAFAHLVDGAWAWVDLPGFDAGLAASGLVVAPEGTVWVSGGGGVFSFDGVEWTRRLDYSAGGVAVAPDGTVWIGGGPWLARWDDGSWIPATNSDEPMDIVDYAAEHFGPGYAGWPQPGVATSDGEVWMIAYVDGWPDCTWLLHYYGTGLRRVVSDDGTTLRDGDRFYPGMGEACFSTSQNVAAAPNGDIWTLMRVSDRDSAQWLLGRFDGEGWTTCTPPFEEGPALLTDGMAVGPDGLVWFALEDGLLSFDGTDWTYHLQGQTVSDVDVAPDGTVWYLDEDGAHILSSP